MRATPRTAAACLLVLLALFAGGVLAARTVQEWIGLSREQVRERLFAELQPTRLANCTLQRIGEPGDGGYLMCANLLGDVRSAYSYAISGYEQWGCDISTRLTVKVHEYDCFDPHRPSCPGGNLLFHDECVAGDRYVDKGRLFETMYSQMVKNGDAGTSVVMKVDVEGAEWDTFLKAPDALFARIDQMAIELHGIGKIPLTVVRRLKRFFYVVHVHFNNFACVKGFDPFPASAYEVLLVNRRIGVPVRDFASYVAAVRRAFGLASRPQPPNPLDAPNRGPGTRDCQAR